MGGRAGGGAGLGSGSRGGLQRSLSRFEKAYQGSSVENVAIFDEKGNQLFYHTDNARNYVRYNGTIAKDNIHVHNHTNNTSFSPDDLVGMVKNNMKEARVTTPSFNYSIKRPKNGWGTTAKKVESVAMDKAFGLKLQMNRYIARYKGDKKVAIGRAERTFAHLLTKQVSKEFGWSYTKSKS